MTPDGLYWTDDMRVTANSASDTIPQITVDKNHDAHIFWMRDGWYYKKFDRFGNALSKEKQINTVGVGNWFLSEKVVDIDSNQDIHFVWVPGGYSGNVQYIKYDNQGNVLIPEMTAVTNQQSTHVPNMAVSSDDACMLRALSLAIPAAGCAPAAGAEALPASLAITEDALVRRLPARGRVADPGGEFLLQPRGATFVDPGFRWRRVEDNRDNSCGR